MMVCLWTELCSRTIRLAREHSTILYASTVSLSSIFSRLSCFFFPFSSQLRMHDVFCLTCFQCCLFFAHSTFSSSLLLFFDLSKILHTVQIREIESMQMESQPSLISHVILATSAMEWAHGCVVTSMASLPPSLPLLSLPPLLLLFICTIYFFVYLDYIFNPPNPLATVWNSTTQLS